VEQTLKKSAQRSLTSNPSEKRAMARNRHRESAPERILAALNAHVPADAYDPAEIETLPISAIRNRLVELSLPATVPVDLQRAIVEPSTPPTASLFFDKEQTVPKSIERMRLVKVTRELERLGINYRAGLADITALVEEHASRSVARLTGPEKGPFGNRRSLSER
jgi:hypothetical protein